MGCIILLKEDWLFTEVSRLSKAEMDEERLGPFP
jgi:hypothetical protein